MKGMRTFNMTIGTRSVLYGAHCFFIHPFFVALGWWKLYGFPWDPRLWVAFFVHDLGYLGKPNIDGPEGQDHVFLGAKILGWLFDWEARKSGPEWITRPLNAFHWRCRERRILSGQLRYGSDGSWYCFSFYHSRSIAKRYNCEPSRLCYADKLAACLEPRWFYMLRVRATGEVDEYVERFAVTHPDVQPSERREAWFRAMRKSLYEAAMRAPCKRRTSRTSR